jgi:hypothetical protein
MMLVALGDHDNNHKCSSFADEQVKTRRLEGKVKDLNESLRTQHNQAKEVTEWAIGELA